MNRRAAVVATGAFAILIFAAGAVWYGRTRPERQLSAGQVSVETLVRAHSPVMGPYDAPVTIVEFFDPSCEACRAFYPFVKRIMETFPGRVRLVIRYTPFHEGSDEAVRILETARSQDRFVPVLEALLARQPEWAIHGAPNLPLAWSIARMAGLDVDRARREMNSPDITRTLEIDIADLRANGVTRTPTFFVNGKPLVSFGPQQLLELVRSEVIRTSPP